MWRLIQKGPRGHDHSGRTETALDGPMLYKSILKRVKFPVLSETFYGQDVLPPALDSQYQTGEDSLAIHDHRAGTAFSPVTSFFSASQTDLIS